jgi:hypothetical protein
MPTSQAVFSLGKTKREFRESISQRIVGKRFSFLLFRGNYECSEETSN